jgi:hypothetical protein
MNSTGTLSKLRPAIASLLIVTLLAGPASAWGRLGHRVAGKVAEDRLTPAARAAVQALLEPGESLADVSTWADEHRRDHPETSTWHYVNVPITEPVYHHKFSHPKGGVVIKIDDFRAILADPTKPRLERQQALKFLAHFVEDMHQPVHVGHRNDKGGNDLQVRWFDQGSNLHRVWDSGLLEKSNRTEAQWVSAIESSITPELAAAWSKGTPSEWANESLDLARLAYKNPPDNAELKNGAKLGQPYVEAYLPLAERRVAQAGVRLAMILNETFK